MSLIRIFCALLLLLSLSVHAGPEQDREAFQRYFLERFPGVPLEEFANGIYALDEDSRQQWLEIEEFPPYEFALEQGKALYEQRFASGGTYSECFENGGLGIRQHFPYFDAELGQVVTLPLAINQCRTERGEAPYRYDSQEMIAITAWMAYTSRGEIFDIKVDSESALQAYTAGKQFYYSKRGQLNFSCADCHVSSAGFRIRADKLSTSLGHPTHFPVYRSKLGEMISLHQRFSGCVRDVRARPFELQSQEFRNLEYFLTYMSNGLPVNGPGARK
jgi:sulfur-oxidizing protein SoxA